MPEPVARSEPEAADASRRETTTSVPPGPGGQAGAPAANSLQVLLSQNRQFLLYCLIGGITASLDFLVYSALLLGAGLHHQVANAIGYGCGTALSFLANARLNFKTRDKLWLRFLSFCAVGCLGLAFSAGLLYVLVDRFGFHKLLAKLVTIAGVVLLQYNLNRLLSFRKSPPDSHG